MPDVMQTGGAWFQKSQLMKPSSRIHLAIAAVALGGLSSCVPPDQRNNPENAARLAPVPFVKIDKEIVVERFDSGEPQVTLYPGVYKPLRRKGLGTIYANESKKVRNAVAGRDQIGGFVWADSMSYPYGYCLFSYDTSSFSANWTERPTDALRHITR